MDFFRKKINPTDPKLQVWIKWYTTSVSISLDYYSSFPELQSLLNDILPALKSYQKKKLFVQTDRSDKDVLIETFELQNPLSLDVFSLFVYSCDNFSNDSQFFKQFQPLLPIFFRYLCHYGFLFSSFFPNIFKNDETSQKYVNQFITLIKIINHFPLNYLSDVYILIEDSFIIFERAFFFIKSIYK